MTYVKDDAYLALKSKVEALENVRSELEELKATVARSSGRSADNLFGPMRLKSKKASSPLLGDQASKVSLVYRMKPGGAPDKPFPPDFLHNDYWEFVGSIQPTDSHLLDFSGHIGEIRATVPPAGSDEDTIKNWIQHIPVNWVFCDGRTVQRPDESSYEAPNYLDRILRNWPPEASALVKLGSKSGSWEYHFSGKTGPQDHNHTHQVVAFTSGAASGVGKMGSHTQTVGLNENQDAGTTNGNPDAQPGIYGRYPITDGISHDHAHNVTLSSVGNRPPLISVWYIQRFF